nr:hypothetical protein [Sunxiuqinia sp.]
MKFGEGAKPLAAKNSDFWGLGIGDWLLLGIGGARNAILDTRCWILDPVPWSLSIFFMNGKPAIFA